MAAQPGREVLIKISIAGTPTTIGGMRAKSISLNDGQVDATDSDSAGRWRELLAGAGVRSAEISGSGVFKDSAGEQAMMSNFFAGTHPSMQFVIPGLGTISGVFQITQLQPGSGNHDNEVNFSASFASAGEITFTAA